MASTLANALTRQQTTTEAWNEAGKPLRGPVYRAYQRAAVAYLDAWGKDFDRRNRPVKMAFWEQNGGLCPDVRTGCSHIAVMNENGAMVACK